MTLNPLNFADEDKVPQTSDAICLRSGVEQRLISRSFNFKLLLLFLYTTGLPKVMFL